MKIGGRVRGGFHAAKICIQEIRISEVGKHQVGVGQGRAAEIRPDQIGAAQNRLRADCRPKNPGAGLAPAPGRLP